MVTAIRKGYHSNMLQRFRSAQPALKTLTSLPAPEQSAQMLVIEVGKKEMSKRKGSMTDLFRRLSRSSSKQRLFSHKGQLYDL